MVIFDHQMRSFGLEVFGCSSEPIFGIPSALLGDEAPSGLSAADAPSCVVKVFSR